MVLVWLLALQLLLEILTCKVQVSSAELDGNVAWTTAGICCSFQFSDPVLRGAGSGELWVRAESGTREQENQNSFRRGEVGLWMCWYLRYQEKRGWDGRSVDKPSTAGKSMRKPAPMLKLVDAFPTPPPFTASPFPSCSLSVTAFPFR